MIRHALGTKEETAMRGFADMRGTDETRLLEGGIESGLESLKKKLNQHPQYILIS